MAERVLQYVRATYDQGIIYFDPGSAMKKSSRQGGVTLSSSEEEFVAASQNGQEVIYLRALLLGFGYPQVRATEI